MLPFCRLGFSVKNMHVAVFVALLCAVSPVTNAFGADDKKTGEYAMHDYTAKFRLGGWFASVSGEIQARAPDINTRVGTKISSDLGYDSTYASVGFEAAYRLRNHDFWISGSRFDEEEHGNIRAAFKIDERIFELGADVRTEVAITDIDFRYGYSFYNYQEDGFRFGPTLAVAYTDFDIVVDEVTVGPVGLPARWSFSKAVPIPTIGLRLEIPYKEVLFAGRVGAFYINFNDVEATGARAEISATWRPYENVGFFAGFFIWYADLQLANQSVDDLVLYGPSIGIEFRF